MPVTTEQVKYIAELARLSFNEAEQEKMTRELNMILHYVEKLNEIDTTGVEPLSSIHEDRNVLREDVEVPSLPNVEGLRNAPDRQDRFFKVPKVIG